MPTATGYSQFGVENLPEKTHDFQSTAEDASGCIPPSYTVSASSQIQFPQSEEIHVCSPSETRANPKLACQMKAIIACGIVQIICGALLMILGIIIVIFSGPKGIGIGVNSILTAILAILAGAFAVRSGKCLSLCSTITAMVLSILAAILAGYGVGVYSAATVISHFEPNINHQSTGWNIWLAVIGLEIVCSFVEFIIAIVQAGYSCLTCCGREPAQIRVVYIPVAQNTSPFRPLDLP